MANSQTALQIGFVKAESTYGTVPTFANSNAFASILVEAAAIRNTVQRPDRTGSFSQLVPNQDSESGTWNTRFSLAPSGTAGTAPDTLPFFVAGLGASTTTAGVKVVVNATADVPSFSMQIRDLPTTVDQIIARGCVTEQMSIEVTDQFPIVTASGPCANVIYSKSFASIPTAGRGGLSSFPAAPTSPTTNGRPARRGEGSITIDGRTFCDIRQLNVNIQAGRGLNPPGYCGGGYPASPKASQRLITSTLSMVDDDSTDMTAVKALAEAGTPTTVIYQFGTTAGLITKITLRNVVLPKHKYSWQEESRLVLFENMQAAATGASTNDEIEIEFA